MKDKNNFDNDIIKGEEIEYIDPILAMANNNAVPGFTTSLKTRPLIVAKLEEFIRNRLITVYSKRCIEEMRTFVWNNGRPQAMRSCNDDLIMSLAIACWVRDTAIIQGSRESEYKKAMLGSMSIMRTSIDTRITGMRDYSKNNDLLDKEKQARKQVDEFMWLYKG